MMFIRDFMRTDTHDTIQYYDKKRTVETYLFLDPEEQMRYHFYCSSGSHGGNTRRIALQRLRSMFTCTAWR